MPKKKSKIKLPVITQTDSGKYYCRVFLYTDPTGKKIFRSITVDTYEECARLALETKSESAEQRKAKKEAVRKDTITVGTAVERYIDSKAAVLSPSSIDGYRKTKRCYLDFISDTKLTELTTEKLQVFIGILSSQHSPKTVSNAWGLLRSALSVYAPELNLSVTLPRKEKNEVEIPTEAEMQRLFDAAENTPMEISIYLAACCGLRRSEISALTWECVDLKQGTLTVRNAIVRNDKNEYVRKGTKTAAGTRTIRLFPFILDKLKEKALTEPELITLNPNMISKRYDRLKEKADFRYNFHALRHYCVSVMLSLNIPKNYIADYVGHETENMIDRVYGHIMQSKKSEVEDALQNYYNDSYRRKG